MLDPGHREAGGRDLDDEAAEAVAAWRLGVGIGRTAKTVIEVGHRTLADEPLRAGQDVVVAVADGRVRMAATSEPASASVRANAMSCSPDASRGTQRACCSGVPASRSGSEPSSWTARIRPGRRAGATELLDRQAQREELAAEPTVLHRERQGQDVLGSQQLAQVLRELAGPVDLGGAWRDPFVGDDANGVAEEGLLLGQPIGGRRRLGHHRHPSGFEVPDRRSLRRLFASAHYGTCPVPAMQIL